jgi:hypothetical protein
MEKIIEIQNTQKRKIAESFYIANYPNFNQKIGEYKNEVFLNNIFKSFKLFPLDNFN